MYIALRLGCRVLGLTLLSGWVAQHIASCPLAGAVGCVLPSCEQGLAEPASRGERGGGENKSSSSWGLVLLLLILVSVLLGWHLD